MKYYEKWGPGGPWCGFFCRYKPEQLVPTACTNEIVGIDAAERYFNETKKYVKDNPGKLTLQDVHWAKFFWLLTPNQLRQVSGWVKGLNEWMEPVESKESTTEDIDHEDQQDCVM